MTEHGCRIAPRPPDAALDPVDVTFIGIEDRMRVAMDQRDALLAENKMLWDVTAARERELTRLRERVATLERHLERVSKQKDDWRAECLMAERRFRWLIWIAVAVIAVLAAALARRLM